MSVSDVRDFVLAVESNKQEATQIAENAARKLETREVSLIEVVQSLGEYINDEDDKIRARAVSYLTAVISALPPKHLSRQQIQVLCQFLCDRIEDGPGALDGLSKLQSLDRFTQEMAQTVVRAIYEHFSDLQTRTQAGRYRILQLLNEMMEGHRKAVRAMGDESLVGTVNLVAGEKDPRNLMLIFSLLRVIMVEWDISKHTDVIFDSVYAYFPITFRPPPNDPYGITAQDLKDRLRDCIAATGVLAPSSFPNLLDKLDSTSPTVKRDVLQALTACATNYGPVTISPYAIPLWDSVKFEILQAQEPELAEEALSVLSAISETMSTAATNGITTHLGQFLGPLNRECLDHLQEPASRQAKASGDILKAVAGASTAALQMVVQAVGPSLLSIYAKSDAILHQRAILEVTNQLFEASIEVYGSWTSQNTKNPEGRESVLYDYKDKFVAIYSQALMGTVKEEVSFRLTAASGLLLISKMKSFLQDDEIGMFVQYFDEVVLKEESYGRDELKKLAMNALAEISRFKPRLISDITFPAFMARLPDSENEAAGSDYIPVLEGLAEISIEKEPLETLMRRLLNKLDILFNSRESSSFLYTRAILSAIHFVLERTIKADIPLDAYFDRVVVGLSKKSTDAVGGPLLNEDVLDLLGRISNMIVRKSSPEKIQKTANNVYLLFREMHFNGKDVRLGALLQPPTTVILSTWLLASLPRDTKASVLDPDQIIVVIEDLVSFASHCQNRVVEQSCLKQLSLLVNKHLIPSQFPLIEKIISEQWSSLQTQTNNTEFQIRLSFTLVKALTLRLAPNTNQYLAGLVDLLDSKTYPSQISKLAALGFSTILAPDDVLSKANFAQIRLLSSQRVFQTLTPLISSKFKASSDSEEKENYLVALSGVIGSVPSEIVMPELPTLLPLLLQSLDISDQNVKMATLDIFAVVISNNPKAIEESGHISSLAKRLITTAKLPKQTPSVKAFAAATLNTPQVRRLATKCLTLMPKYLVANSQGVNPLLTLKKDVLQGLIGILDDPKRDVRKEAVDARAAWIRGIDDVDSDEDD